MIALGLTPTGPSAKGRGAGVEPAWEKEEE